jgi:predicted dehydrogenase
MMTKAIVIGARRANQGIGEYVAGWLAYHGVRVCAIVGTSRETVERTRIALRQGYGIECRGYTTIRAALDTEHADMAAICSPYRFHAEHLRAIGRAGLDCLCEKPLYGMDWSGNRGDEGTDPVEEFAGCGQYLGLITQWPFTLDSYYRLYPEQRGRPVERFAMGLGPISTGAEMVPDAAPHMLSMLRRLVGSGHVSEPVAEQVEGDPRRLRITFVYNHTAGATEVDLRLATCEERPRPAWYAINGARVDREIVMPAYEQRLCEGKRSIVIEDPLKLLVADFLQKVKRGAETDTDGLLEDQRTLSLLYRTAKESGVSPTREGPR